MVLPWYLAFLRAGKGGCRGVSVGVGCDGRGEAAARGASGAPPRAQQARSGTLCSALASSSSRCSSSSQTPAAGSTGSGRARSWARLQAGRAGRGVAQGAARRPVGQLPLLPPRGPPLGTRAPLRTSKPGAAVCLDIEEAVVVPAAKEERKNGDSTVNCWAARREAGAAQARRARTHPTRPNSQEVATGGGA